MQVRHTRSRRSGGMTGAGSLSGISIRAPFGDRDPEILTPECLGFVRALVSEFGGPIRAALAGRENRRKRIARGAPLGSTSDTRAARGVAWVVADVPPVLERRFAELVVPPDGSVIADGLGSGADVIIADFEDAASHTWAACLEGQIDLWDAVRASLGREAHDSSDSAGSPALFVRPRALHLVEGHMRLDGRPVPAALFDFGLFFFHNALPLAGRGEGPFFDLVKLESHLEARIWSQVFGRAEQLAGLPGGTVKAAVQIDTVSAAFEMDEILWELRHQSAGLACGYPGYLFSLIKTLRHDERAVLPDLGASDPVPPCLRALTRLLVQTAHRRGSQAIGGLPEGTLEEIGTEALGSPYAAARRGTEGGLDGIRVVDPGRVPAVRAAFLGARRGRSRREVMPSGRISASDLLRVPTGRRTERALRRDIRIGLRSIAGWLSGEGAGGGSPDTEDVSSTELRRSRVWQLIRHQAALDDGHVVTAGSVRRIIGEEALRLAKERSRERGSDRLTAARTLLERLCCADDLEDFLTIAAYNLVEDGV